MANFAIIKASELGDRWDASFHVLRKANEPRTQQLERELDRSAAIEKVTALLQNLPLKFRRDLHPLCRGTTTPSYAMLEGAVREYPYLSIAILEHRADEVSDHYAEEARKHAAARDIFRALSSKG